MATRVLKVEIVGDARGFSRAVGQIEGHTRKLVSGFGRATGLIAGGFAALGGAAIVGGLKSLVDEAREAERVGRITEARIKSTGGAANVSAKDIDRLTTSLSNQVGVDDDLIASGANLMLTFKGVRNETGRNNDIFNQATKLSVDLAAGMNEGEVSASGLKTANIQLGRALEDPIRGISALRRSGVSFTEAQREQIKTLVESGKTLEAQKVILKAVGDQFAGTARAASDPWQRFGVVIGNIKERLGGALIPILNRAADTITGEFIPAAERWWKEHGPKVREAFSRVSKIIGDVADTLTDDLFPAVQETVTYWSKTFQPTIEDLTQAWKDNKGAIKSVGAENKIDLDIFRSVAGFLGNVMAKQVERLTTLVGVMARAWKAATSIVNRAVTFMVVTFVEANRTIFRVAATAAEKLHLPFARGLRAAEREMGQFVKDYHAKANAIKDEGVNITVKGVWVPPRGSGLSMHDIVGRAEGGSVIGAGTSTSDSIPAMLSHGEHVLSAREVRGMGGHGAIEAMRREARGFAAGGAILPDLRLPPAGALPGFAGSAVGRLARAIDRLSFNVPIRGNPSIMSFIRSVDPRPYIWGGVGPGGYDCSGLVGEVMARHLGLPSYRRYFTTASIHTGMYGLKGGLGGILDIGVTAGTGHMAGSYMGLGFEAESTASGIKIGGAASRPGSFARHYHLAKGGPVIAGDPSTLVIDDKVFKMFDRGGWLPPGLSLAYNGTGRPERVSPPGQGGDVHVHLHGPVYGDRQALVREVREGLRRARRLEGLNPATV